MTDELKRKRNYNILEKMVNNAINVETMTDNELVNVINTTNDLELLEAAEDEFVRRNVPENHDVDAALTELERLYL